MAKAARRPTPGKKPRLISVAMIAKNEAENLPRAVESARRFADEIVLVDTGSTDDTVEVAKSLGCRVHHFKWIHDYAAARNFSFSKCRCEYIFWQDPDEEVPEEDAERVRNYASQSLKMVPDDICDEFVFATYLNGTYRPVEKDLPGYGPGFIVMKPRMVRRGSLSWRHPIHEDLYSKRSIVRHTDSTLRVFNHGNAATDNQDYYFAIMYLAHRDHPTEPHYLLYLAEQAQVRDLNPSKALNLLQRIDQKKLVGDQAEKFWLFVGRCQKMEAIILVEQEGGAEASKKAVALAVDAYNRCKTMRGPLECASMFLYMGGREQFDDITTEVLRQEPDELMAQRYAEMSSKIKDTDELNKCVGRFLGNLRGGQVDMEVAMQAALKDCHPEELKAEPWDETKEHRQITIIIVYRLPPESPKRRRNLSACLEALSQQDVPMALWKLILVEQDSEPKETVFVVNEDVTGDVVFQVQRLFDRSYEPFNRGSAFNFGFDHTGLINDDLVCLMDADMLVDPGWLRRCLTLMGSERAMLPYDKAVYMDERTTVEAIEKGVEGVETVTGETFHSQGGCIWLRADLHMAMDGHDDRFIGWGSADRDFYARLVKALGKPPARIAQNLYHMWHESPDKSNADRNAAMFKEDHGDEGEAAQQ